MKLSRTDILRKKWFLQQDKTNNPFAAVYNFIYLAGHIIKKDMLHARLLPEFDEGVSMFKISEVLKAIGIENLAVKIPMDKLKSVHLPAIALMFRKEINEYVVINSISDDEIAYINPRLGWTFEPLSSFREKWDGYLVMYSGKASIPENYAHDLFDENRNVPTDVLTIFDDLLSTAECEYIIQASQNKFQKSLVTSKLNARFVDEDNRKSESAFLTFDDPALDKLYVDIAYKLGFDRRRFEPFQCVRYFPGHFFDYHYDVLETEDDSVTSNPRSDTLLIYLSDSFLGGETAFPLLNTRVRPLAGRAVLFRNLEADGSVCKESVHAGLPVIEGEKYALNLWIHRNPLSGSS